MTKNLMTMAAAAALIISCTPRVAVPERFSTVTDTLSAGKNFAMVDWGGEEEALLVIDCGEVFSQGTAYPLAVKDSCLFTAGHRFIQKHTFRNGNGKMIESGNLLEVLDSLGEPLHYVTSCT